MITNLALFWLQLQFAQDMMKIMNTTADPCVDFYEFACGNFENIVKLPDDKSQIGIFSEAEDTMKKELRAILDEPDKSDDPTSTLITKEFYRSCVNEKKLEELGVDPLRGILKKFGGWPVVDGENWNGDGYDWMVKNADFFTSLEKGDILTFSIGSDFKNTLKKTLFIDQASLVLGRREFYLDKDNKKILDAYYDFMVATAVQLGASEATAKEELQKVVDFETELANITVRKEDRRDKSLLYHPIRIKDLKEKYPTVNFDGWFKEAAKNGFELNDADVINLSGKPFLEKLPEVLANYSARTFANYQIWKIAVTFVSSLAPSLREPYRKFEQALTGTLKFKARWEECVGVVAKQLELPVGAMYAKKYFSQETKEQLDTMVTTIRQSMKTAIDSITWMDDATKAGGQKKLANMIQNIAFPSPDLYNETYVMRDFKKANVSEDAYMANKFFMAQSSTDRDLNEFRDSVNRTEWQGAIAIVNAWYTPELNMMTFPAGILRYPWFHPDAPDYYNYGHIGSVMGHELTHGFDDQGRQNDEKGNLELWWSNETLAEFSKGAKCFIDLYGNITDERTKLHLNGRNTQGENIADNGGLRISYQAYRTLRKNKEVNSDPRNVILPNMANYTADQLFFLSYGQSWCGFMRSEALKTQIISNPHSPDNYRVIVPLQNSRDFAEAYNCPVGTPMNPEKKCQIW